MPKVGELSNRRVLVVDDQEEIHQDFVEMLQDDRAMASDQAAPDFGPTRTAFELPTFDLQHANSGEEAIAKVDQARGAAVGWPSPTSTSECLPGSTGSRRCAEYDE